MFQSPFEGKGFSVGIPSVEKFFASFNVATKHETATARSLTPPQDAADVFPSRVLLAGGTKFPE